MPNYEVIVGNIGCVYNGTSESDAIAAFNEYAHQSEKFYGRASGESVTLMQDNEITDEVLGMPSIA